MHCPECCSCCYCTAPVMHIPSNGLHRTLLQLSRSPEQAQTINTRLLITIRYPAAAACSCQCCSSCSSCSALDHAAEPCSRNVTPGMALVHTLLQTGSQQCCCCFSFSCHSYKTARDSWYCLCFAMPLLLLPLLRPALLCLQAAVTCCVCCSCLDS